MRDGTANLHRTQKKRILSQYTDDIKIKFFATGNGETQNSFKQV